MDAPLLIRELERGDVAGIVTAFDSIGWNKPAELYECYLDEQASGRRVAWIALAGVGGDFAGYVTVNWESSYPPFQAGPIPEIQDFNVLPKRRRQGIGTALLDQAEGCIARRSSVAGIGVGLGAAYGSAQRLYVSRGYVPDGRGVTYRYRTLEEGETTRIDDDIALWFTRELNA